MSDTQTVLDLALEETDEADDVLVGHGWVRVGPWWATAAGAVAQVVLDTLAGKPAATPQTCTPSAAELAAPVPPEA